MIKDKVLNVLWLLTKTLLSFWYFQESFVADSSISSLFFVPTNSSNTMSQAPKRDPLKPTRCAYLIDDLADSIVSLNFSRIKSSLSALRECHKNKSINADREEKPKYVVNDRSISFLSSLYWFIFNSRDSHQWRGLEVSVRDLPDSKEKGNGWEWETKFSIHTSLWRN